MIAPRRLQRSFGDGLIAAEIKDLHEVWMPHADIILADDEIVHAVHQALVKPIFDTCSLRQWGKLLI